MDFVFYPKHEHRCPHVGHCPHLGGAGLGSLVLAANEQGQYLDMLHGQLDAERRSVAALVAENERLRQKLEQCERELKTERQRRYCKDRPTKDKPHDLPASPATNGKKRGAPRGHPGWWRQRPTEWDKVVDVPAPSRCPHCGGGVHAHPHLDSYAHVQEGNSKRCRERMALPPVAHRLAPNRRRSIRAGLNHFGRGRGCLP